MIFLLGDVHGSFDHVLPAMHTGEPQDGRSRTAIFLGAIQAHSEKRMRRREQEHANTRESLERMLASFDVERHGGEVMAFPAVGREAS